MLRSTQTSSTRPCRLRFVNNSEHPVDVSWITYEGTEQSYASVPPNSQHVQGASMSLCTKTSSLINLKYVTVKSFNDVVFLCCLQPPSQPTLGPSDRPTQRTCWVTMWGTTLCLRLCQIQPAQSTQALPSTYVPDQSQRPCTGVHTTKDAQSEALPSWYTC